MRNLTPSDEEPFEFFEKTCKSKKDSKLDPQYKTRLSALAPQVKNCYLIYNKNFNINQMRLVTPASLATKDANDLDRLYNYKGAVIQKLKQKLTTSANNRKISTCQNCTISEVNSFDHLLPRMPFMEFVVHPKNLFPSCTICNGYKSTVWLKEDMYTFLNLYLDQLPDEQYVFVNINMEDGVPVPDFKVKNKAGIDRNLFNTIYSHYSKLHLPRRFKENADQVITPLKISIESYLDKLPLRDIIETQLEIAKRNQAANGNNYWKSILEIALLSDKDFLSQFIPA